LITPVRPFPAIAKAVAELKDALQTETQMIGTIRDGDADDETGLDHPAISVDQGLLFTEQGLVDIQPAGKVLVTGRPHQGFEAGKEVIVTTDQGPSREVTQARGPYLQELGLLRGQPEQMGYGMGCHGCPSLT
jgi:hypothetical protein